jgi:adenosine deaminase
VGERRRNLADLPKAHLHLHLEGCMRPATLRELAQRYGLETPTVRGYGNFAAFHNMYVAALDVLREPADLSRLIEEVVDDAASDGAVWIEPAICPPLLDRFGSPAHVLEIAVEALSASCERHNIAGGFMLTLNRADTDPRISTDLAALAARYAGLGVASFGLANDENVGHPEDVAQAFTIARNAGLLIAPHAGELAGPESVRRHLEYLRPDRIEHGIRAVENPELVQQLIDDDVCLDICLTSNLMLGIVDSIKNHPLGRLLDAGVACTLNVDDSLLFGPGLLDEYQLAREELRFSDQRLATIAAHSIRHSAAPAATKHRAIQAIAAWLAGDAASSPSASDEP